MSVVPTTPTTDPNAVLEQALVEEYLSAHGYTRETVERLPPETARHIMAEATRAADARLAEIESRARWVEGLHHE